MVRDPAFGSSRYHLATLNNLLCPEFDDYLKFCLIPVNAPRVQFLNLVLIDFADIDMYVYDMLSAFDISSKCCCMVYLKTSSNPILGELSTRIGLCQ